MDKYNVLDLFAGCGGLSKGFEQAGFNIIAANEFWKPAQETYIKNHPNTKFFPGDVTSDKTKQDIFDFFKDKKCDIIIGGPPCQAYSTAGLRNPDDPRGRLFEDYVEIVQKLQPKIFVMENVRGILTMKHEKDELSEEETRKLRLFRELEKERDELILLRKQSKNNSERFKFGENEQKKLDELKTKIKEHNNYKNTYEEKVTDKIIKRFSKLGYNLKFKLLNAADYGVPQKRQRAIFIGTRLDIPIKHPEPTHGNYKPKPWVTIREAIDDLKNKPEDVKFSHIITAHNEAFTEKIKNTPVGKSVYGGFADAFFRNSPDEPSRTVKENHGGVIVHYEKNRVMTPRELARLQSFPDEFVFEGTKSNILKQIGNAVPPGLGKAIGQAVMNMLKEDKTKSN